MNSYTLVTLAVAASALAWGAFVVWYTMRAKWWRKPLGWNTFGVSFILFVTLLRDTFIRISPDLHRSVALGLVVYTAATALGVQRLIEMEKAQREMVHFEDVK